MTIADQLRQIADAIDEGLFRPQSLLLKQSPLRSSRGDYIGRTWEFHVDTFDRLPTVIDAEIVRPALAVK